MGRGALTFDATAAAGLARAHAFIVGTGRCGSTLLSDILALHPTVLPVSEFLAIQDFHAFAPGVIGGRALWRRLSTPRRVGRANLPPECAEFRYPLERGRYRAEAMPPLQRATLPSLSADPDALFDWLAPQVKAAPRAPVEVHYGAIFERLCQRFDRAMWVERSGFSLSMIGSIVARFPDAKIVHVVRDGRDVALSMTGHPAFRNIATQRRRFLPMGLDLANPPAGYGANLPLALLEPTYARIISYERDAARPHPATVMGKLWRTVIEAGLPHLQALPAARFHAVRYERLLEAPHDTIGALYDFLDAPAPASVIAAGAALVRPRPPRCRSLSAADRDALSRACGPALHALGYPAD